jgi:ABC-type oligopeptide transport system substrate-binding subunit
MRKKVWFSASLALAGAAMLAVALFAATASAGNRASNAVAKKGGTLNFGVANSDVDYSDPALAYGVLSWEIEYATCTKLLNYPDKSGAEGSRLIPEAAAGFPVISKDGKTYTFTVKPGFKFNTGAPVTAASFAAAINRDADPAMNSPVVPFITDIAGLNAVVNKQAKTVSGVSVSGNKLTIKLTEADGGLLDKLAMPFFCAIPTNLPHDPQGVTTVPGSGPYYIASRDVGKQIVLKRNPNYKGNRPANADTMVFNMNTNPQQTYLGVRSGQYAADPSGLDSPTSAPDLAKEFGINKGRFFVNQLLETDYVALNSSRTAFGTANMRKAMNFALDRRAMLNVRGFVAGKKTDQILPPGLSGGYWSTNIYPTKAPNPAKAKSLAAGKCGNVTLWYQNGPVGTPQSQVVKYNMEQSLGCTVTTKPFQGFAIYNAAGVKGADFDAMMGGWNADYPDAYDFFHILLDGTTIHETNNNNLSYINDPTLNKRIFQANLLTGDARSKGYGQLDVWTMQNVAPWAPIDNRNQRDFIGPNVGGYLFQPAYAAIDLGALFLK